jgi:Domain of unknown function (DUF4276)
MFRVNIICEGQTEETFVQEILYHFFVTKSIYLTPILIGKPGHKGGNFTFGRLLKDLRPLLGDSTAYCTTLFDFYGLPNDFPGKATALTMNNIKDKAQCVTKAVVDALQATTISPDALRRFIPYIQMYEFEGLLFSDCSSLASAISQPHLASKFQEIRASFASPEHINNSPMTAPSKRISKIYSRYDKPLHGSLAMIEIGIEAIRQECKLFDRWLQTLENLPDRIKTPD